MAIIPPTKSPTADAILIFPGSFSGAKISVRRNLKKEVTDENFSINDEKGHTLRTWTRLDREVLSGRDENVIDMQAELKVLHDEPLFCVTRTVETRKRQLYLDYVNVFRQCYPTCSFPPNFLTISSWESGLSAQHCSLLQVFGIKFSLDACECHGSIYMLRLAARSVYRACRSGLSFF